MIKKLLLKKLKRWYEKNTPAKQNPETNGWSQFGRKFAQRNYILTKSKKQAQIWHIPALIPKSEVTFIIKMVKDELQELKEAKNITDQVDAYADAIYYLLSSAAKYGINLDPVMQIVHEANMNKLAHGRQTCKKTGKVEKPFGWVTPEKKITEELKKQVDCGGYNPYQVLKQNKPKSGDTIVIKTPKWDNGIVIKTPKCERKCQTPTWDNAIVIKTPKCERKCQMKKKNRINQKKS